MRDALIFLPGYLLLGVMYLMGDHYLRKSREREQRLGDLVIELHGKLMRARHDTERLDWLENAPENSLYTAGFREMFAFDPRGAIDEAMSVETTPSKKQ